MPTTYAIKNGATAFAATTYNGTGGANRSVTNTVNGVGFQPDLVWIKRRDEGISHALFNSIVGGGSNKGLFSNSADSESSANDNATYGYLTSFDSNGFTGFTGSGGTSYTNYSGGTYVAWQWKAGGTAVSNTAGSITSSVSANTTTGFSVVTYSGTANSSDTIGHGLGAKPAFIIVKVRNQTGLNWTVYHSAIGATQYNYLSGDSSFSAGSTRWNNTEPTTSVFTVGASAVVNGAGSTFVAYCWTPIPGYSAFGSYTGTGATDGPFVYLGFKPRFLMIKDATNSSTQWTMIDSSRNPGNTADARLIANLSNAENAQNLVDLLSNGFKLRDPNSVINNSGANLIYMAFAECPFKYANAR